VSAARPRGSEFGTVAVSYSELHAFGAFDSRSVTVAVANSTSDDGGRLACGLHARLLGR
jgi:hypothetical protein